MLKNQAHLPGRELRGNIHQVQKQFAVDHLALEAYHSILDSIKKYEAYQVPTLSIYKVPIYKIFREPFWQKSFKLLPNKTMKEWEKRVAASNDNINPDQKKIFRLDTIYNGRNGKSRNSTDGGY